MFGFVYTKAALLFYLFVILTELATRYGLKKSALEGNRRLLSVADGCGMVALLFMLYYSIQTVWYAFVLLILCYVCIYMSLNFIISVFFHNKKFLRVICSQSRFLLIPVIILMFLLVNH